MTKVEFPKFLGDDVKGWIFRCEQFFSIDEIPENQKVTLISVHLFDTALLWHRQFIRINGKNVSWNVYKSGILQRLPAEIEMGVRMFGPKTLADAYRLTNYQEATLEAVKKKSKTTMNFSRGRFGVVVIIVPDDEDCFEDYVDELEENRNSIGIQDLQPQISLNALTGTNNFQTLRVIGTVGKHLVHILVDCESTHNFLDKNMAKKLGCSIRPTRPLAVIVADGNNLWLATLGDIKCNFKELRMEFKYEGKKVQLRGTHKSNLVWMSDKKSEKNARQVVQGEFHSMTLSVYPINVISCSNLEGMPMEVDERIKTVLKNYEDVFRIPVELPSQSSHDHRIPLVERALPVNIRPYRHPPTQKDVIESMVKELLEAGVIKKSHSPFASPIVMCVFGAAQVEYLGHVISAKGVAIDPAKIEVMANWPMWYIIYHNTGSILGFG
ncbi:hypothetical protein Tco_1174929 [Tanacetum coccineum]